MFNVKFLFFLRNFYEKGFFWWCDEVVENFWNIKNKVVEKVFVGVVIIFFYGVEVFLLCIIIWLVMMFDIVCC